jgi:hypothetical protein
VDYVCLQVVPVLSQISSTPVQLETLKLLAEMTSHCGDLEKSAE